MHFLKNVLSNIRYSAIYTYSVGGLILPPAFLDQLWSSPLLKVFWVLKESTRGTCLLLMLPGNTQKQSCKLFENDTANAYVKHSLLPFLDLFIYSLHRRVGIECFFSSCEAAFFTSRWYLCGSRERLSNDDKFVLCHGLSTTRQFSKSFKTPLLSSFLLDKKKKVELKL